MASRGTITNYQYGLEIIEGLMGAGKSYYAVRRICDTIEETRRPVYTNLPLRWPVVRAYLRLKGGEELADLIRPLKEKHWRRFLLRQHAHAKFREHRAGRPPSDLTVEEMAELAEATGESVERLARQPKIYASQMWAWFHHLNGEDVFDGHDADSIPLGAIIVIDEVQHWHPMLRQGTDPVRENLQAYLTMIRHHLHWMWVITQDRSRIDILMRNLAQSVWRVWDRGEDRIIWGLRFKHVGLRGMGYERYTREQLEGTNRDNLAPSESFTIIPQLPQNKVYFRLYDSFTNVGSKRQIQKVIERARTNAGLRADGVTDQELKNKEEKEMAANKKPSFIKRTIRRLFRMSVVGVLLVIAFAVGLNINPKQTIVENIQDADQEEEHQLHNWPKYNGFARDQPLFNGRPASVGQTIGDRGRLEYIDTKRRSVVLVADDGYWLWRYGERKPQPVGTVATIQTAYERWLEAGKKSPSEFVQDVGATSGSAVGSGDGFDLGD